MLHATSGVTAYGSKGLGPLSSVKPHLTAGQQKIAEMSSPSFKVLSEKAPKETGFMGYVKRAITWVNNFFTGKAFDGLQAESKSAQANIARLQAIGAEKKVLAHAGGQISTLHLTTEKFSEAVKAAGGKFAKLNTPDSVAMSGLVFSVKEGTRFIAKLEELGVRDLGWQAIKQGDKYYFVSAQDAKTIGKNTITARVSNQPYRLENQGTMVLCQGIKGRMGNYTSSQEAVSFLLRGQDVLLFDYRSCGQSEGKLSEAGIDEDMEVIHGYLKSLNVPDECMTFKGTCFGGGPATRLAAKYPVNLFLDQTYSDAKELAYDMIEDSNSVLPVSLQKQYFDYFGFSYNVAQDLQKVKGHIAIATNLDDKKVKASHAQAQFEALAEKSDAKSFSQIILTDIDHAEGWFSKGKHGKNEGSGQVDAFLHNLKATHKWESVTNSKSTQASQKAQAIISGR